MEVVFKERDFTKMVILSVPFPGLKWQNLAMFTNLALFTVGWLFLNLFTKSPPRADRPAKHVGGGCPKGRETGRENPQPEREGEREREKEREKERERERRRDSTAGCRQLGVRATVSWGNMQCPKKF